MSVDTVLLKSEPQKISHKGSNSGCQSQVAAQAAQEVHRHLRDDMPQIPDGEEEIEGVMARCILSSVLFVPLLKKTRRFWVLSGTRSQSTREGGKLHSICQKRR